MARRFRKWLNVQQYAESTQHNYHRRVLRFCSYIGDRHLRNIKPLDVADFLTFQQQPGWSDSVVSEFLAALRCFFDFLYFGGVVDSVAPRFLRSRPRIKRLPRVLTRTQVRKLIAAATNPRDRALVELYYATGCRNSELTAVRIEDIDFRKRKFKVRGKRRERFVYFGSAAAHAIRRYIGGRRNGYLFQDIIHQQRGFTTHNKHSWMGLWRDWRPGQDRGKRRCVYLGSRRSMSRCQARAKLNRILRHVNLARPKPDKPLTKCTMGKIISDMAMRAGLGPMGPKTLRHSFGTHLVEGGANILAVQELMGHSYLSSTQVYVRISNRAVAKAFRAAHPRGK